MKRSIFFKFVVSFFLVSALLILITYVATIRMFKQNHLQVTTDHLHQVAMVVKERISGFSFDRQTPELDSLIKHLGKLIPIRLTVVAADGRVLADSEKDPSQMENHALRPEIQNALKNSSQPITRFSSTMLQNILYYAVPLSKNGRPLAILRVSVFVKSIDSLTGEFTSHLLGIVMSLLGLSLAVAFLLSRHFSRPIRKLSQASKQVAAGDLNQRVLLTNRDELRVLAQNFNHMVQSQKELVEKLQQNHQKLKTIVESISDGLLVLRADGHILLANDGFMKLVADRQIEGKHYWEVFRHATFSELYKKALSQKKNLTGEIEIQGRTLMVALYPLESLAETVITFHDISELRRIEKMKKDFMVNLSHELRTPLTAIKGYIETMEDEETTQSKKYVEIIKRHTDRLIALVSDLLDLTQLEEKGLAFKLEEVELKSLLENVIKIFEKRAEEKKLKLSVRLLGKPTTRLQGDPYKLEQMVINLVDNAVRFTNRGEISIELSQDGQSIQIAVRDTGIGISPEHLPRIFERFYVVDRSRSREFSGTGLGLAIVKHIVLLHNGDIAVASTPGQGTAFTIRLPIVKK